LHSNTNNCITLNATRTDCNRAERNNKFRCNTFWVFFFSSLKCHTKLSIGLQIIKTLLVQHLEFTCSFTLLKGKDFPVNYNQSNTNKEVNNPLLHLVLLSTSSKYSFQNSGMVRWHQETVNLPFASSGCSGGCTIFERLYI